MSKNEVVTILIGLKNEHAKKAAEIWGDADGGVHGDTARALLEAVEYIEQHGHAVDALNELRRLGPEHLGMSAYLGLGRDYTPEETAAFNAVLKTIQVVQNIVKRGLKGEK